MESTQNAQSTATIGNDGTSIWMKYGALGKKFPCANMAQGFPNWKVPEILTENLKKNITTAGISSRSGINKLNKALAKDYSTAFNFPIDADKNIALAMGGTNMLFSISRAFLKEEDEVVTFEPFYDIYGGLTGLSIAKIKPVTLIPPPLRSFEELQKYDGGKGDIWTVDFEEFEQQFTEKTKLFILNTPHNPTGKVFTQEELEKMASILKKWPNVVVACDEVYEHLFFKGYDKLPRMANIPGMEDRCISFISAGKTFSITGMRLAWAIGPESLISPIKKAVLVNSKTVPPIYAGAVADTLEAAAQPYEGFPNYYDWLRNKYESIRNRIVKDLAKVGAVRFWIPEGGYFLIADISDKVVEHGKYSIPGDDVSKYTQDINYMLTLFYEKKILTIPLSHFYAKNNLGVNFVRFSFCKTDETIELALKNFQS